MSSEFKVDLDELDRVVSRLNALSAFVSEHLDGLDDKVKALHSGSWESAAATAYADAHAQWLAAAREFAQGIADMSEAAQQAHGRYTSAIDVNRRMLQSGQP
ncbi:WXG100 family type VII secretion target [Nocardia pseudobrasiliensis]|uniref:ESAT-6-like protein n=1 Tax=Nocardia pseudobrasiliensis TaxID=45979 RepID=A0A370I1U2_9NOCA|nr:WXG100 family type VII secretion target [Nocardia pseudobrasiliensis]RDI64550.1 WXG100 family type VII secretion target [Nocardia pseudobrasiliensis]